MEIAIGMVIGSIVMLVGIVVGAAISSTSKEGKILRKPLDSGDSGAVMLFS